MQKHIDEDSAQRQKEIKTPLGEKVNVQREIDESVKFSKSMVESRTSEQLRGYPRVAYEQYRTEWLPQQQGAIARSCHAEPGS